MAPLSKSRTQCALLTWLIASDGTTSLEYALILGILVGAGLLAIQSLSERLTDSYSVASAALMPNAAVALDRPVHAPATNATAAAADQHTIAARALTSQWVPLAVALAAVGLLVVQRRAARENAASAGAQNAPPAADAQPAYLARRQEILRIMAADVRSLLRNQLLIRNVMATTIHPVPPSLPAAELKQLMAERKVRHVLVCTPDRKLLGVISDRDLPVRSGATAADFMTKSPATVAPDVAVASAVSVMLQRRISSLPVVERETVVGIVTMTDVAMTLQCALQSLDKVATELEQHGLTPPVLPATSGTKVASVQQWS